MDHWKTSVTLSKAQRSRVTDVLRVLLSFCRAGGGTTSAMSEYYNAFSIMRRHLRTAGTTVGARTKVFHTAPGFGGLATQMGPGTFSPGELNETYTRNNTL